MNSQGESKENKKEKWEQILEKWTHEAMVDHAVLIRNGILIDHVGGQFKQIMLFASFKDGKALNLPPFKYLKLSNLRRAI